MTALQPPWATGTGDDDIPDEFAPSNEPLGVWGVGEPSHGDEPSAEPESQSYGRDDQGGGTTPDVRLNLWDNVKQAAQAAAPVIEHHHVVENVERGAEQIRIHQETVNGVTPTTLLQQNPLRRRALLRTSPVGGTQFQTIALTSQSASAAVFTIPAGQTWTIQSLIWRFVTSAVAGNRQVQITVRDPLARVIAVYTMTVTQPAATDNTFEPLNGATVDTVVGTTHYFPNIFSGLVLGPGSTVTFNVIAGSDAGDVISAPQGDITTVGGSGSLFLMPSRDGANAAAPGVGWLMAAGDVIEIKSQAAVDGVGSGPAVSTLVYVYEELVGAADTPGLAG